MARPPASNARELELIDALPRLSARRVAELVYGDPALKDRVLRRRARRRRTASTAIAAMSDAELYASLDEIDEGRS